MDQASNVDEYVTNCCWARKQITFTLLSHYRLGFDLEGFPFWNICMNIVVQPKYVCYLKSDNLQYNTLVRWLVNQASDVPYIILFHNFLQNSLQKSFKFIFFYEFAKTKIKSF
jgi:hypothetical protein